jgi:hypothetical protein
VAAGTFNPDAGGTELTDGYIGGADGSYSPGTLPGLALWNAGAEPEFTVDLGSSQSVAAFRVWSHAPSYGDGHVHPDHIEFSVSTDNVTFTPAGSVTHDQLWDPQGDYFPWEHDDSPGYNANPHKGRLLYGFRLIPAAPVNARYVRYKCYPLEGKAMGFWELQAYGSVTVTPWENMLKMQTGLMLLDPDGTITGDSDADDLPDAWELAHFGDLDQTAETDYDDDGACDGLEFLVDGLGFDPTVVDFDATTNTDADGMPDIWEYGYFHDLDEIGTADNDGDGLANNAEYGSGTSPILADTDGDTYSDGAEITAGTDPLDPDDHPVAPQSKSDGGGCVTGTPVGPGLVLILLAGLAAARPRS